MNAFSYIYSPYVMASSRSAGTVLGTDNKIRSFSKLPRGWHYGRGGPIDASIIKIAREYLSLLILYGFIDTEASPGAGGEILVAAYREQHCLEVIVETDKKFTVSYEFDGKDRYRESDLSGIQACEAIRTITAKIEQEKCNTSSWSISNITVTEKDALTTLLSGHLATGRAHQSYWKIAEFKPAEISVHISTSTIPALAANLPFSGGLIPQFSQHHAISSNRPLIAGT